MVMVHEASWRRALVLASQFANGMPHNHGGKCGTSAEKRCAILPKKRAGQPPTRALAGAKELA